MSPSARSRSLFAFLPRHKSLVQVAALAAALLIAAPADRSQHWFYLYIVWFYPLLLVALAAVDLTLAPPTASGEGSLPAAPEPSPARTSQPAPRR